jgi:P-type conjugative transfer protein TrbJ
MTARDARHPITASIASLGLIGAAACGLTIPATPASAIGITTVFDPTNYSQNLLTAAHTLQQINNQILSLQNQAQSLINQAKNLSTISFPELAAITSTLRQIDTLMSQAQGISFRADQLKQQFDQLFPQTMNQALNITQQVASAQARLSTARAAFQQSMTVQARIAENIQVDGSTLGSIVAKSQGAQGALQAAQATNQLLALAAKQQFQIQNLMAAQFRADAIEQARRAQSQSDGQAATAKFLGSGTAYTPQ